MEIYHLAELSLRLAEKTPSRTALLYHDAETDQWKKINWQKMGDMTLGVAKALAEIGIQEHARVGIYSQNMRYYLWAEMGIFMMRAISVPLYATSSPEQIEFVVKDAEIELMFVGEQFQYNNAFKVQQSGAGIRMIVIFDRNVAKNPNDTTSIYFDEFVRRGDSMPNETMAKVRSSQALESDLATIIYTSGTTGNPKGVTVAHSALMWQIRVHQELFPSLNHKDISMCFLPLSHIFEKAWTYMCLSIQAKVAILSDPKKILMALVEVRPTLMCNVPRFWEKIYQGVNEKIASSPKAAQRIFRHAISVGKKYRVDVHAQKKRPSLFLRMAYRFYDATLYKLLRSKVGLQRIRFCPTAGAPLSLQVNTFLQSVGFPIVVGYGLSESCATVSCYQDKGFVLESIGDVIPGMDVKIDPDSSEILLKGHAVTKGYYNNPEANAEAFTSDGWFRTGDAGRLEGRTLFFVERIKELYKTANGKYVAPQAIEGLLSTNAIIEQVAIIGDCYKFVSALIYPNWDLLRRLAKERGLDVETRSNEELKDEHEIIRIVMSCIEEAQSPLAQFEKVKRITLLAQPFSVDRGELTNTLKLRRKVILERYADEIAKMYVDGPIVGPDGRPY
ncbi:MAG: long-chain fatty acid--CoA ligase [Porphyromonas sp.]|nr:long-chain fatty acid--CoA ligase [Porphyromonas sp.]